MENIPFQISLLSEESDAGSKPLFGLNRCGFFLCTRGTVTVSSGIRVYCLEKGSLYIHLASTFECITQRSDDAEGFILNSPLDYVLPIVNRAVNSENLLIIRSNPCILLDDDERERLAASLLSLHAKIRHTGSEMPQQRRILYTEIIKSLAQTICYEMFFIYFGHTPVRPLPEDRKGRIFQNFILNVYQHYRKERNVTFYASRQCLSERYFSTIIKELSGHTASFWIIEMVIAEAKRLLDSTTLTVKEIAFELNFPTQSFFGKYFKHYTGMSPQEYRKSG